MIICIMFMSSLYELIGKNEKIVNERKLWYLKYYVFSLFFLVRIIYEY